jgi:4-hydroxy-tetrahydrodipicolinate synthase
MIDLQGQGVALTTPFTTNLDVDFNALRAHVENLITAGVDYLVVLGTTAETATLSLHEKKHIAALVAEQTAGRVPLVLGIGGNHTAEVVRSFSDYDLTPYQAVLSVCPYYNKPSQEGLFQHFKTVASHSPLPLVVYNVPSRTGVNMEATTVARLAEQVPNIIGIKEASSDFNHVQRLLQLCPRSFQVVSGDDSLALATVLAGGIGVISVIGNAFPEHMGEIINLGLQGQNKEAYALNYALQDTVNLIFEEGNPTGIKALLSIQKKSTAAVRLPLVPATDALTERLRHEISLLQSLIIG